MHRRFVIFPGWAILAATGCGLLVLFALLIGRSGVLMFSQVNASTLEPATSSPSPEPELGPRHQLTYERWVELLQREAKVAAEKRPPQLTILAGDSLSLWFPQELLPLGHTWLNQGISGETSYGLLKRLRLFDATQPTVIFVMIGINDLIRGVREETLIANQREITRHLKAAHPKARVVIQSILPHGGSLLLNEQYEIAIQHNRQPPPWVDRLHALSNKYIRKLNERLAQMATEEKVDYLDLHSHFMNEQGDMIASLTTDGLHLSPQGYQVWKTHLEAFNQRLQSSQAARRSPQ